MDNTKNSENVKISFNYLETLINKISNFDDDYSKNLLNVFYNYRTHKDFNRMHKDLEQVKSNDNIIFRNRWDLNTRAIFFECIYPAKKLK